MHTEQVSADLELPKWIVYACIPLGSYLMCYRFLQVTWGFIKTGHLPHADHGHVEGLDKEAEFEWAAMPSDLHPKDDDMPDIAGSAQMNGIVIFALLIALMLTGMPISISLGLTVLTFLFTMTEVPLESVALKLFTGIEKFEIMAIPFFILAGTFLTHGGVAKRMIRFATALVGHLHGGLALGGVVACALFAAVSGSSPGHRGGHRLDHPAGDGQAGLSEEVRHRRHRHLGRARHPDPAVDRDGHLRRVDQLVDRAAVHRGHRPGHPARAAAAVQHVDGREEEQLPAHAEARACKEVWSAFRESVWGLLLIVVVIGGIYSGIFTPTEAAAMSAVYAFFVSVFIYKDLSLKQVPKVLLDSANLSAMILYIITNAVLFSFLLTSEQIPQAWPRGSTRWACSRGCSWWSSTYCC